MNWFSTINAVNHPRQRPQGEAAKIGFWLAFAGFGVTCSLAIVKPILGLAIIGTVVGIGVAVYLFAATLNGTASPLILTWALLFPLGYYFLSFPRERSIITLDRVLIVVLLVIGLASHAKSELLPRTLRTSAIAWTAFLIVATVSLIHASSLVSSSKELVDAFLLPALLFWCVFRSFDVRRYTAQLDIAASVMALYTMLIAVAEDVVKEDLLPLPGSGIMSAGSIIRPNGPFSTCDSLAVVGAITFFLLLFLRSTMNQHIPLWHVWLHRMGVFASLAMALMPMFRAVAIGLLVPLLLETWCTPKLRRKMAGGALLGACAIALVFISVYLPEILEDRSQMGNVYSRMAQQRQNLEVFLDHPFLGVGLGQFSETVKGETGYLTFYQGIDAPESPHNTTAQIAAETGLLGLTPYVVAQIYLVVTFLNARKRASRDSRLVWRSFLYLFVCCFIQELSASSGFASDVNLWYIFAIAIFYKYYTTEPVTPPPFDTHTRRRAEFAYVPA